MFFPSRCISCNSPISYFDRGICFDCLSKVERVDGECPICSGNLINGRCEICGDRKFYLNGNISLLKYKAVGKDIVVAFKYRNQIRLLHCFTAEYLQKIKGRNFPIDVITFIPMGKKSFLKRGYNQTEILAHYLSKKLKIPMKPLLKEVGENNLQKEQKYIGRFLNVIGKYKAIKQNYFFQKNILIVDDVLTTGATLNECARLLLDGGASSVYSATLAMSVSNNDIDL